jgi:hypothetical protein
MLPNFRCPDADGRYNGEESIVATYPVQMALYALFRYPGKMDRLGSL